MTEVSLIMAVLSEMRDSLERMTVVGTQIQRQQTNLRRQAAMALLLNAKVDVVLAVNTNNANGQYASFPEEIGQCATGQQHPMSAAPPAFQPQ